MINREDFENFNSLLPGETLINLKAHLNYMTKSKEKKEFDSDDTKDQKKIGQGIFQGAIFLALWAGFFASGFVFYSFYSWQKDVAMATQGVQEVSKGSVIEVNFTARMNRKSVEKSLEIIPSLKVDWHWEDDKHLRLTPQEELHPATTYSVKIADAKTAWMISQETLEFQFAPPSLPQVEKAFPVNESQGAPINQALTVNFDQPLRDDFKLKVKISPKEQAGNFKVDFSPNRDQLILRPSQELPYETPYSWEVVLEHKHYPDFSQPLLHNSFVTKEAPVLVYAFNRQGEPTATEVRTEEIEPQILEGRYIHIDISSQALFLFEDGEERGAFKVSTGKRGMDTPLGEFQVMGKSRRPWSGEYELFMPWFIQFTGQGHGIHELPEWPGGYKEGANHLGIPVSHGCVRLGVGPAKQVYDFVEVGTPLVVTQ